jgi:hypothetical protein
MIREDAVKALSHMADSDEELQVLIGMVMRFEGPKRAALEQYIVAGLVHAEEKRRLETEDDLAGLVHLNTEYLKHIEAFAGLLGGDLLRKHAGLKAGVLALSLPASTQ